MEQPFLCDYHIHTHFSDDSSELVENICEQAIARGLSEIVLTDHAELRPGEKNPLNFVAAMQEYARAATLYQGRLRVKTGVELGQMQDNPAEAARYYETCKPDFIIGSIHYMADGSDPYLQDYRGLDCEAYYADYLERLFILARDWDFDVLGHLTYPLRYLHMQCGHSIDLGGFTDRFQALFSLLKERGRGIEINASGYRQSIGTSYPPAELLRLYHQCGGEIITVGSDAHRATDVGSGIVTSIELLREIGFRYITCFENRQQVFHSIKQ